MYFIATDKNSILGNSYLGFIRGSSCKHFPLHEVARSTGSSQSRRCRYTDIIGGEFKKGFWSRTNSCRLWVRR